MRHYVRIILANLNFWRPKLDDVATQIWVATHYLRTPDLTDAFERVTLYITRTKTHRYMKVGVISRDNAVWNDKM